MYIANGEDRFKAVLDFSRKKARMKFEEVHIEEENILNIFLLVSTSHYMMLVIHEQFVIKSSKSLIRIR